MLRCPQPPLRALPVWELEAAVEPDPAAPQPIHERVPGPYLHERAQRFPIGGAGPLEDSGEGSSANQRATESERSKPLAGLQGC